MHRQFISASGLDRRLCFLCFAAAVLAVCAVLRAAEGNTSQRKQYLANEVICGPRCARYILRHYEKSAPEFRAIVREIQWPEIQAGTTLARLKEYLEKHDLHAAGVSLSKGATLDWPHPAILHLEGSDPELGHFAVWLPSSTRSRAVIWDGLRGIRTLPAGELSARIDGGILLTSPEPIRAPERAVVWTADRLVTYFGGGLIAFQAVFVLVLFGRRRKR